MNLIASSDDRDEIAILDEAYELTGGVRRPVGRPKRPAT